MKPFLLFATAMLFVMSSTFSQKQKFDIATFTPPRGWQQIDSNGIILLQQSRVKNGLTSFCQIYLFPSQASSGNTTTDFMTEWNYRVVRSTGTREIPKTVSEKTPDGWVQTSGYANITQQGITYTCMLVSISGFGKEMSVAVNVAGQDYMGEVQLFFKNLDLRPPVITGDLQSNQKPPETPTGTTAGSLSDYVFTAPPGWALKQYSDGIVLSSSPARGVNENCLLTLWPMRNAGNNLWNDAYGIFSEIYKGYEPRSDGMTQNSLIRGVSPQGWEYCIIKKSIGMRGYATLFGFVFVAKLGNQLAPISGMSKDPMVSACFGELIADVWPKFFYSLQFKNWKTSGPGITKKIIGDWIAATASASSSFTFAPNGRYGGAAASQYYNRTSGNEVVATTQAYFGDGSYSIIGNQITLVKDSQKNQPEKGWIRLEEESKDEGRTWMEKLYLLRTSTVDGKEYELYFKRNK